MRLALLALLALSIWGAPVAVAPTHPPIPDAARASSNFDAKAATDAWLNSVPARDRARSDAYFEGGYWLILWDFLVSAAVLLFLLESGLSARMRDWAERLTRFRPLQSFVYAVAFAIAISILTSPWAIYEGFVREHQYGLSNQNFGSWFHDQAIILALAGVFGGVGWMVAMGLVRRFQRTWHVWLIAAAIAFLAFAGFITPVFLFPLFNTYKPLADTRIKERILSVARENGIPAKDVYEIDASRQSKRVSANVSGFLGTERITLNDNLLNRCSPEGVIGVMGHEMGHYVLHHLYTGLLFFTVVFAVFFTVLRVSLERSLARWGERWRLRGTNDAAMLPLAALLLSVLSLVATPLLNTFTRTQEYEADIFGLNAARQPDGEAEVDLLLGEYRKLDPGPLEEFIFFDHPSGRTRIYAAMRWKAENLCLFDAKLVCKTSPELLRVLPTIGVAGADHSLDH